LVPRNPGQNHVRQPDFRFSSMSRFLHEMSPKCPGSPRDCMRRADVYSRRMKKIISTPDAPAALGPYSQAVRVGSTVYCAGQIPLDPKTGEIVSGGIEAQTRRVMDNITAILKAEGLTCD